MYLLLIPISIAVSHGLLSFWEGLVLFFVAILFVGALRKEQ